MTLVIFPLYLCYAIVSLAISLNIYVLYLRSHFVPKIIQITIILGCCDDDGRPSLLQSQHSLLARKGFFLNPI